MPTPQQDVSQTLLTLLEGHFEPRRGGFSFLGSLAFHSLLILGIPWLAGQFDFRGEPVAVELVRIEPLQLRIPEHLYLARSSSPGGGSGSESGSEGRSGTSGSAAEENPATPGGNRGTPAPRQGDGAPPAPRRFELPELPRVKTASQTLLQPQLPPDLAPQEEVRLPDILLWAETPLAPPPPPREFEFVMPGTREPPTPALISDAPPKLEMPNRELVAGEIKIASAPLAEAPELPVPPANVAPIRTFVPPEIERPKPTVVLEQMPGPPTNLLATSPNPAPMPETLVVPGGNLLEDVAAPSELRPGGGLQQPQEGSGGIGGEGTEPGVPTGDPSGRSLTASAGAPGLGGSGQGGAGGSTGAGFGRGAGGGARGGTGSGSYGSGSGSGPAGTGSGSGASGLGSGSGGRGSGPGGGGVGIGPGSGIGSGSGSGTGSGSGPGSGRGGGTAVVSLGPPAGGGSSGEPVRTEHASPGVFDVVVVGSSAADGMPSSAGILSGKPVYSVYLNVGASREWMLQYCIPEESGQRPASSGGVVTIVTPTPVSAPYPRVTVVPPPSLLPANRRIMVHGYLRESGHLRDLRILGDRNAEVEPVLLPLLEEWVFFPATQEEAPVEVELLIVIPPSTG